jgi:hypothetical protein
VRVLALLVAAICGTGCSLVLGIDDPTPDFGDDTGPRTLVSISIAPDPLVLPLGGMQQISAVGHFDDGSAGDITAQTEFAVASGSTITVTPAGLAKAIAEGPSTVTATLGRVTGQATGTVGAAAPDHVVFSLTEVRIAQLQSMRLHALVVLTDGMMQDATANATYASDTPAVAVVPAPGQIDAGSQAGMATISATIGGARAGTMKVTVTPKTCRPLINEFQTGSAASGADEWVEIINPCTAAVDVTGWTLVYRAMGATAGPDTNLLMSLTGSIPPGELRLFAGQDFGGANDGKWAGATGLMKQDSGAIALRSGPQSTGPIVDSVAYGAVSAGHPFVEANPTGTMVNGRSAQRLPFDGRDDDDGAADFVIVTAPSPRARNVL